MFKQVHPQDRIGYNVAEYMHYYGVNFRHLGLLRFHLIQELTELLSATSTPPVVPGMKKVSGEVSENSDTKETVNSVSSMGSNSVLVMPAPMQSPATPAHKTASSKSTSTAASEKGRQSSRIATWMRIQSDLLGGCICRTLKCMMRASQRGWMEVNRTPSEHGVREILVKFLNLITGAHPNSEKFWRNDFPRELIDRFGCEALEPIPTDGTFLESPEVLGPTKESLLVGQTLCQLLLEAYGGVERVAAWSAPLGSTRICLWKLLCKDPKFLYDLIPKVCLMTGLKLSQDCLDQFNEYVSKLDTGPSISPSIASTPRSTGDATPISRTQSFSVDEGNGGLVGGGVGGGGGVGFGSQGYRLRNLSGKASPRAAAMVRSVSRSNVYIDPPVDMWVGESVDGPTSLNRPNAFEFVVSDIAELVPVVKHLHQLDYFEGKLLAIRAEERLEQSFDSNVACRLNQMAKEHLWHALKTVPDDLKTRSALADVYQADGRASQYQDSVKRNRRAYSSVCDLDAQDDDDDDNAGSPRHSEKFRMYRLLKHEDVTRCEALRFTHRGKFKKKRANIPTKLNS